MKHKKLLITLAAVVFFLTALTFYANRVIFPRLVKKIAIEQAQNFLKRKVEIEDIRFSWVKGFIIDKVKVYQKDSDTDVFVQANRLSFGIIFIPGFQQHKITFPIIKLDQPSVQLVRFGPDTWNFSDLIPAPAAKDQQPRPFSVSLGAINIDNGKLRVDDHSQGRQWTELFDAINLKMSLSYKGITFDFSAAIPQKQGVLSAQGSYQPLTGALNTELKLKNLDSASYLSFIKMNGINVHSGIIQEIALDIDLAKDRIAVKGDLALRQCDITVGDKSFKGDIDLQDLNGSTSASLIKGSSRFLLSKFTAVLPGLNASGNWKGDLSSFQMDKDILSAQMNISGDHATLDLGNGRVIKGQITGDDLRVRKDKEGTQIVGAVMTRGLDLRWDSQSLKGDITFKPLTLRMTDANHIELRGDLRAETLSVALDALNKFSGTVDLKDMKLELTNTTDIALSAKMKVDDLSLELGTSLKAKANLNVHKLLLKLAEKTLKVSVDSEIHDGQLDLSQERSVRASPQVEGTLTLPLDSMKDMTYEGSITVSDLKVQGFPYAALIKNIELDADLKTNTANINALSVNILDTTLRATGSVVNFTNPLLNIAAESSDLNLAKLKEIIPDLVRQYGLDLDGIAAVKVKFEGMALDPLSGKILAVASLKDANISSSIFNQSITKITGVVEATPDTLKWRDFSATYLGQPYTLNGELTNFKEPKATTSLDGADVQLKADFIKDKDLITVSSLKGKYLDIDFDAQGSVLMVPGSQPLLDLTGKVGFKIENLITFLPQEQKELLASYKPAGSAQVTGSVKGQALDWKHWDLSASAASPEVSVMGYTLQDLRLNVTQSEEKIKNLTIDGNLYGGTVHAVGSADLSVPSMPFDLALNLNETDLRKWKMDSPLKAEEINGKAYLTSIASGRLTDIANLRAKGSFAIREGFLTEFKLFKGLLGILNEVLRLGQLTITDVEANFILDNQKISTENLRLKSPTIVLVGQGWVNFDQYCDLTLGVDLTSGIVPPIAEDVLRTLSVHITDKISNPKFRKKISVPQVINTILKNIF